MISPLRAIPKHTVVAFAALGLLWSGAASAGEIEESNSACLDCHDGEDSAIHFADGSTITVGISADSWKKSAHSTEVRCKDCHTTIKDHPHPAVNFATKRAYQLDRAQTCKRCHYAYHTKAQDSIHAKELAKGNDKAPTCTDCHGVHNETDRASRQAVTLRCGNCHAKVAEQYAQSVHGAAWGKASVNVPMCVDCHGAHAIMDPRKAAFHRRSWDICSKCHSDAEKMAGTGLSTKVVETYLDDFHGRSNERYAQGAGSPRKPIATCSDCHGVHDIRSFRAAKKNGTLQSEVIVACRKCHKDAPPAFADAWLSHDPPTLASAPLVVLIQWGYRVLSPLIMAGLVLHILLHLWRARVHR